MWLIDAFVTRGLEERRNRYTDLEIRARFNTRLIKRAVPSIIGWLIGVWGS